MKQLIGFILMVAMFIFIICGSYWVVKNASYKFFYESMVEKTVTKMVKQEYLNKRRSNRCI